MKYSISLIAAILTIVGCHSRQPVIYADSEGLRIAEQPPRLRPAREPNARLRAANSGRLVVQTEPSGARVTLDRPGATGYHLERVSSAIGITEFDDLQPGEYAATARRVGLRPQTVRISIAAGFTDTLLFSLGQP
jgi:hypothetical protein